jgi:hypothetical protein
MNRLRAWGIVRPDGMPGPLAVGYMWGLITGALAILLGLAIKQLLGLG